MSLGPQWYPMLFHHACVNHSPIPKMVQPPQPTQVGKSVFPVCYSHLLKRFPFMCLSKSKLMDQLSTLTNYSRAIECDSRGCRQLAANFHRSLSSIHEATIGFAPVLNYRPSTIPYATHICSRNETLIDLPSPTNSSWDSLQPPPTIAFFAVIDPPKQGGKSQSNHPWKRNYSLQIRQNNSEPNFWISLARNSQIVIHNDCPVCSASTSRFWTQLLRKTAIFLHDQPIESSRSEPSVERRRTSHGGKALFGWVRNRKSSACSSPTPPLMVR